jgi:hypothetical protein
MTQENKKEYISWHDLNPNPKTDYLGNKHYYLDGDPEYKYVVYTNGDRAYFKDTRLLHNETGPAYITANGKEYWYLNDEMIDCETQQEFESIMKLKVFW